MNPEVHLSQDELLKLAALTRDPSWGVLVKYLDQVRQSAGISMRKLSNTLQAYGYWSGVIQIIEDIESLPADITKIIHAGKETGHED